MVDASASGDACDTGASQIAKLSQQRSLFGPDNSMEQEAQKSIQTVTSKSIVVRRVGGPEVLGVEDVVVPDPARNQVGLFRTTTST